MIEKSVPELIVVGHTIDVRPGAFFLRLSIEMKMKIIGKNTYQLDKGNGMKIRISILLFIFIFGFGGCTNKPITENSVKATQTNIFITPFSTATPAEGNLPNLINTIPPTPKKTTQIASNDHKQYKGIVEPPLPEGTRSLAGALLEDQDYALSLIENQDGLMLWLERKNASTGNSSTWRVIDVLLLTQFTKNDGIYSLGCFSGGVPNPNILAVGVFTDEVKISRWAPNKTLKKAWIIDTEKGIFQSIPTTGIECSAEQGFDPNNLSNQ